jgi:5,5'-dehydrodivanillate O-demethylase
MASRDEYEDLVHVGPGTLAGRYLRLFWHPVARAQDLPAGRALPIKMLGEELTLYRGESGTPHVTAFRCAHRGTQLSTGWVEDDCIRCRYHGWKYDASGQCVEQPGEDPGFARKIRIRSQPTREYAGLIFTFFGDGEPPPFRQYPDLDLPGVVVVDPPETLPCSFWNRMDNDTAHLAWTHRSTATRMNQLYYLEPKTEQFEETDYGYTSRTIAGGRDPQATHFFMPNSMQFRIRSRARGYTDRELFDTKFVWMMPVDDETYTAFDVTRTPLTGEAAAEYAARRRAEQESEAEVRFDVAEDILAGRLTIEAMPDEVSHYNGFAIEDYVTQVGQGRIADRVNERLGRTDARVIFKRRLWLRELRALEEGRPLKDWRIPTEPIFG